MNVTGTITGVGVLDKGVALIDVVERQPMGVSELAREVGMTLSTAHRLVMALTAHGLLRRDEEGLFHLGQRFTTSALVDVALPVLAQLRAETGESAQLWVRRGDLRVVLASVDSEMELRTVLPVGSQLPLSAGGSAAIVLSGAFSGEPGQDWAESVSQRTPGIGSVSAPVRQHGEVLAAVCLPAPLARIQPSPGVVHGARVVAAARQIERALRG
jgi:DNA-binding IclR family transcriptional regulator